jgi:hypothetical protein
MLSLQLKKSRLILDKRTSYLRSRLLGKRDRRSELDALNSDGVRLKTKELIHKFAKKHINDQKIIVKSDATETVGSPQSVSTLTAVPIQQSSKTVVKTKGSWRNLMFATLMSVAFALLVTLFGPVLYFRYLGHEVVPVQTTDTGTPLGGEFKPPATNERQISQPEQEESLPEGNWLVIPRIGVRTEILESEDPEESLVKGVWRAPEFGTVGDLKQPMILAAHRYGYNWWWKGEYWKYHSFYLLPDLEPGDVVEVISDKRKYMYEIYSGEEGTEISDYNADLILYTCKFLTSDIRHFRYARIIDPSKYGNYTTQFTQPETPVATPPTIQ